MKRKLIFNVGVGALSVLMAATQVTPAFAGSWKKEQSGWSYINDNGSKAVGWTKTPSGWYYMDGSGIMKTGWVQDTDGNWYFLSTAEGGQAGKMLTGWNWIDGYCYYFNPEGGGLSVNTTTPDGHKVNADGKWEKDGKVMFSQGKGLSSLNTNGANTGSSTAKKGTGTSKGGSGGSSKGSKRSGGKGSTGSVTESVNNNNAKKAESDKNAENTALSKEESKDVDKAALSTQASKNAESAALSKEASKDAENKTLSTQASKNAGNTALSKEESKDIENKTLSTEENKNAGNAALSKEESKDADKATLSTEVSKNAENKISSIQESKNAEDKTSGIQESKNAENKTSSTEVNNNAGKNDTLSNVETNSDKFAYVNYTKNINTDFGEYVVVTFKYGTIDNYRVLVDGTDVTASMTKVDDEGHVVKWLSTVKDPSALQIVSKADNDTQDITLAGGEKKIVTKTDAKAPKYVISNGHVTKFDYFLETYDNEGRVRKNASKTTFTLQTKKTDSAVAAVPSKYYIPVTEIDSEGNGSIKIKLQLENEEQENWFKGLNNIKLLNEDHNIVNSNLVYNTSLETKYGKVGVINIPLPQNNARSRGDYYVSVGSSNGSDRISLPISLVSNTDFKVVRDSATPNPKVGKDVRFKIVDKKENHTFGNDAGVVMYKVTLTKPDGTSVDLPKYSGWYNIGNIVHISGTDSSSGKVYTDVPGVYTVTIYTKGYKTLIKKFEVLNSDGSSAKTALTDDDSKTVDAVSTPTVSKTHVGNREDSASTSVLVGGYGTGSHVSSGKKTDAISGATNKSGGSGADATSGASGSMMINAYLMYDYDLLANAMVLNEIGLRSKDSDAVMKWWLEQIPEAIVGEDKSKLYKLDDFIDAKEDARLEGRTLTFEEYANSSDAATRNIVGNVKNVLENGKLGTIYRYGNIVGEVAPVFEGLIQPKAESYTFTTDNTDFIEKLQSVVLDGSSAALRNDSYLKQYEISADKKSITIYKNAFNEYIKPTVGNHTLSLDATGYEKITLDFTVTDTVEDVVLTDVSEKLEAGSPVVIKAVKDGDPKQGDFLSKLANVKVQGPDGMLRDVISALAGGNSSDSVYSVADGKVTLRGGLFKDAGEYTIYLQSSDRNYPVKYIKVNLSAKAEVLPPAVPEVTEAAKAPTAKSGAKTNSFFYEMLTVKFEGMDAVELEKYLKAVKEVSVNEEAYAKTSSFGFGDALEFKAHSNAIYGGKISELSVKAKSGKFNSAKYNFVVKAEGYEDLTFTLNADGTVANAATPVVPTPVPAVNPVEIEKVLPAKYNNASVYAITLKGDQNKIDEFIEKLNAVAVNGVNVSQGRISILSNDAFSVSGNVVYVKSAKFRGRADTVVLKGNGIEDLSFTTESKIATPEVSGAEVTSNFFDRYARITFDASNSDVLRAFMKEIKAGNATVTVNGITYNKGYSVGSAATYKISSNSAYGYDQYLDFSLDGFTQANNEVVITSDSFDTIRVNVEVGTSAGARRTRRDLSAFETATSSNANR
jgi:hypothetical protein